MNRSGFKRPHYERKPSPLIGMRHPVRSVVGGEVSGEVVEKEDALQDRAYMAAVRTLACAHCGWPPPSQFCHSDEGKGGMIKTDCRRGWPGCGPRLGEIGCHALLGSTGKLGRDVRRDLERRYAAQTRDKVRALGLWPAGLPEWSEE